MNPRTVSIALAFVVGAVVLQSTLFADGRIEPFGAAPNVVVLVVIATVRYLDDEPALLTGFTAGLLVDLLGGSPLGLWAMTYTVIAYLTLRLRDRADDGVVVVAFGVFALSVLAAALFATLGTLFGQRTLADPSLIRKLLLPGVYNVIIGGALLPAVTLLMGKRRARSWAA